MGNRKSGVRRVIFGPQSTNAFRQLWAKRTDYSLAFSEIESGSNDSIELTATAM